MSTPAGHALTGVIEVRQTSGPRARTWRADCACGIFAMGLTEMAALNYLADHFGYVAAQALSMRNHPSAGGGV